MMLTLHTTIVVNQTNFCSMTPAKPKCLSLTPTTSQKDLKSYSGRGPAPRESGPTMGPTCIASQWAPHAQGRIQQPKATLTPVLKDTLKNIVIWSTYQFEVVGLVVGKLRKKEIVTIEPEWEQLILENYTPGTNQPYIDKYFLNYLTNTSQTIWQMILKLFDNWYWRQFNHISTPWWQSSIQCSLKCWRNIKVHNWAGQL